MPSTPRDPDQLATGHRNRVRTSSASLTPPLTRSSEERRNSHGSTRDRAYGATESGAASSSVSSATFLTTSRRSGSRYSPTTTSASPSTRPPDSSGSTTKRVSSARAKYASTSTRNRCRAAFRGIQSQRRFGFVRIDDLDSAIVDRHRVEADLLEELLVLAFTLLCVLLLVAGTITEGDEVLRDVVLVDDPVVDQVREPADRAGKVAVDLEVERVVAAEGVVHVLRAGHHLHHGPLDLVELAPRRLL